MRLTNIGRAARTPQNELRVPFKEILPLKLRDHVSGKSDKSSNVSCLQEMAVMFACLKQHDFNEQRCPQQIQNFQSCWTGHLKTRQAKAEMEAKGIIATGTKNISHKGVNRILKRFPLQ